ncbi:MAG: 2-C-methyl-D-erythritol 4-phosphate cytidylyltransferase [Gracilibacteraceae bacterium]|jgi:2-C-methyl-D-erythritol 4-phosphate cytidylyltransferase/2-C-methyl-D-erythritol 2,4-cyclodiphosphate synthase|nr:2-C-methyl-D-erythritol 4-phosphate cytidylyltransferase [Gracilibacteraceae bacterium]
MKKKTRIAVIVPAAGESRRMGGLNKLFLDVAGQPVLLRTVEVFLALGGDDEYDVPVIVAVNPHDLSRVEDLFAGMPDVTVVLGGANRQQSVANGLALVGDDVDYVIVHDGARPLLKQADLEAFVQRGLEVGALVMAVPVKDTVKKVNENGFVAETPRREELWLAQTPQMFRRSLLSVVHAEACAEGFTGTDEASLLERRGYEVAVFRGSYENIKITTPEDARLVEAQGSIRRFPTVNSGRANKRARRNPLMRIGLGYDMHGLAEGRDLILGGVKIPHSRGLLGHSDADVLTRSVMDALLGALALGDIGQVFPDSDAQYKDVCSLTLLRQVAALVRGQGYAAGNVDAVICAQKPLLAPYIGEMRENLAACLELEVGQVSVKATTTERLGPEGREEGISAQAVVLALRKDDE